MNEKVITLPGKEEMELRLQELNEPSHLQEKFFPLIYKHAGEDKVASGVVLLLSLAVHDYLEGMPAPVQVTFNGYFQDVLCHKLIDVLVEDEEVRQGAKDFFQQVLAKRG